MRHGSVEQLSQNTKPVSSWQVTYKHLTAALACMSQKLSSLLAGLSPPLYVIFNHMNPTTTLNYTLDHRVQNRTYKTQTNPKKPSQHLSQ